MLYVFSLSTFTNPSQRRSKRGSSTPISYLPPELLLEVFQWVVASPESGASHPHLGPWTLLEVCRSWESLIVSSPSLWRYITIPRGSNIRDAQRLRLELGRSGDLPLVVNLHDAVITPLLDMIIAHSHRWEHAHLSITSPQLLSLKRIQELPLLRTLALTIRHDSHTNSHIINLSSNLDIFQRATKLDQAAVDISSAAFQPIAEVPMLRLPWGQLTRLELKAESLLLGAESDEGYIVLPSLRVLHCIDEPPALQRLLTLNLCHIILTHGQASWEEPRQSYYHVLRLLQRSDCDIHTLEIHALTHGTRLPSRSVVRILEQVQFVKEVRFVVAHMSSVLDIDWQSFGFPFTFEGLQTFTLRVRDSRSKYISDLLLVPRVNETLEEDRREFLRDSDTDLRTLEAYRYNAAALLEMFQSRRRLPGLQKVVLDFPDSPYLDWFIAPQVLDQLRELDEGGIHVCFPGVDYSEKVGHRT
uniref:Uncharacterized protein n=1 Tax=Moniliophthora roreri TaxID=221103 RepID=A0A0W0FNX5_MONRR